MYVLWCAGNDHIATSTTPSPLSPFYVTPPPCPPPLPQVVAALPQRPLLAAHCLTALSKLRVVLPPTLTCVLWDVMLQHLTQAPGTADQLRLPGTAGQSTPPPKVDPSEIPGALRSALWALCVMYADDTRALATLLPRAQRAAALLDQHPPASSIIAKQLLLARAVFLSVCGDDEGDDGVGGNGGCAVPASMMDSKSSGVHGDTHDKTHAGGTTTTTRPNHPIAPSSPSHPRPPQRRALRCDSPAELFSEETLRACRAIWDEGARTPIPSTVQRQLAIAALMMPDLVTNVQQGVEYLEGGLLRGNLGCQLVATGQPVVLCPTRPGRVLVNGDARGDGDGGPLLDGPMALRFALLRWEGVLPVVVPQLEWEALEDEGAQVEYLRMLVNKEMRAYRE